MKLFSWSPSKALLLLTCLGFLASAKASSGSEGACDTVGPAIYVTKAGDVQQAAGSQATLNVHVDRNGDCDRNADFYSGGKRLRVFFPLHNEITAQLGASVRNGSFSYTTPALQPENLGNVFRVVIESKKNGMVLSETRFPLLVGTATAGDALKSVVFKDYRIELRATPGAVLEDRQTLLAGSVTLLKAKEKDERLTADFRWNGASVQSGSQLSATYQTQALARDSGATESNAFGIKLDRERKKHSPPREMAELFLKAQVAADRTPPQIVLGAQDGQRLGAAEFHLPVTVQDASATETSVFLNGVQVHQSPSPAFEAILQLSPGQNLIEVRSVDAHGNVATPALLIDIFYDNEPPKLAEVELPSGKTFNQSPIMVHGTLDEPVRAMTLNGVPVTLGVASLNPKSDESRYGFVSTALAPSAWAVGETGYTTFTASYTPEHEGKLALNFQITDLVGNTATRTVYVVFDQTPPRLASDLAPLPYATSNNAFRLPFSLYDLIDTDARVYVNGTEVAQFSVQPIKLDPSAVESNPFDIVDLSWPTTPENGEALIDPVSFNEMTSREFLYHLQC